LLLRDIVALHTIHSMLLLPSAKSLAIYASASNIFATLIFRHLVSVDASAPAIKTRLTNQNNYWLIYLIAGA